MVIDEIDGALGGAEGRGAIQALLSIVNGGGKGGRVRHGDENDAGADNDAVGKKTKRKGPGPLMRPIICICNDLYAPALRPLREVAKIFRMVPPASARLNQRLRDVCAKQTLRADTRAINALAEKSEGDVRACLNALQMIAQKGTDAVTLRDVNENVGEKDMSMQARMVWESLLSGHIANKRTRKQTRPEHIDARLGVRDPAGGHQTRGGPLGGRRSARAAATKPGGGRAEAAADSKFGPVRVALVGAVGFRRARGPGAVRVRRAAVILCRLSLLCDMSRLDGSVRLANPCRL